MGPQEFFKQILFLVRHQDTPPALVLYTCPFNLIFFFSPFFHSGVVSSFFRGVMVLKIFNFAWFLLFFVVFFCHLMSSSFFFLKHSS